MLNYTMMVILLQVYYIVGAQSLLIQICVYLSKGLCTLNYSADGYFSSRTSATGIDYAGPLSGILLAV